MISFSDLRNLQLGGTKDAVALSAVIGGGMLTLPPLLGAGPVGILSASVIAALGGGWFGKRIGEVLRIDAFEGGEEGLKINSSQLPPVDPDGFVHLGYVADTGEALKIPIGEWMRHAMIVGQSGVGKTVLGEWVMFQQIAAGGGLMWIDGKLDPGNLEKLRQMLAWCGREDDLLVVNPGDPSMSNTYNPLLDGDPDEIAARCISLIPTAESNAGADYFRQSATIAINTLVAAVQATGNAFNFADLRVLLTSSKALAWLENELVVMGKDKEAAALSLFLDQFKQFDRATGQSKVSVDNLRKMFGGLGSRLAQFGSGQFGQVMNSYDPDVRIKDAVMQGKIVYFMLPTMGKSEAATALAKLAVADFRSAIAFIQSLPEDQRPKRPYLGFYDEAGSYVTEAWSRMFEQSRSARLVMMPAFQTRANLEVLGEELRAMVAGNTLTKIFFKPGEPDTAEWMADMIGKEMQTQYSVSASTSDSQKESTVNERLAKGATDGATKNNNIGYSESLKEDYKIPAHDLMKLGKGECIVTFDGAKVYNVRTPRITFSKDFLNSIGPFHLNRPRRRFARGLKLFERSDEFLAA
ncbi:type IV secretory system conjugative DNA transfer family protein [Rhodanobacter sp. 115]|uniref:type IV secretory system conjugative DNA transfer family protein n=1 Tax=Rhodanobacter sp. FW021-MT20 TaxID=1162282 RepID=UPI0034E5E94B